jgi:hypothetical protein
MKLILVSQTLSYCGMNCEECIIKQGIIKKSVDELLTNLQATGLYRSLGIFGSSIPAFDHEEEFYHILFELKQHFGSCDGCKSNAAMSFCPVRNCAKEKNINSCFDCPEHSTCDKIKDYPWLVLKE